MFLCLRKGTLKISVPNILKGLLIQTWNWWAFSVSNRVLSKMGSSITEVFCHLPISAWDICLVVSPLLLLCFAVPWCSTCTEPPSLAATPACALTLPCPVEAVPAHPYSEQSTLCRLSLHQPPHPVCWHPPIPEQHSPCSWLCPDRQLCQLSWSAAPFVILVLGPSRGELANLADYFLLLNNCPLSKILWLSNHFHWGVKQLLIQGALLGKVSSIKQWTT